MASIRLYAAGLIVAIAISSLFFAPLLGLPAGLWISTGESMGDGGPVLNVWLDDDPEIGDVIIYDNANWGNHDYAAHRVVDVDDQGYVTQGDAREYPDQWMGAPHANAENTVGVVVARVSLLSVLTVFAPLAVLALYR